MSQPEFEDFSVVDSPVRSNLARFDGRKIFIEATFERFGSKSGWRGKPETTILLKDLCFEGLVEDHLWFVCGKKFGRLGLVAGDRVSFFATVRVYWKGYYHNVMDYKLVYPSKLVKVGSDGVAASNRVTGAVTGKCKFDHGEKKSWSRSDF
jgi:hypothetical protein